MNVRRFAGVVAVHEDRVVLVREHRDAWGRPCWSVPSGELQPRESPARGAVRELLEETGLVVPTNDLRLVSTSSTANAGSLALAWNFTAIVGVPHLEIADPDGSILEARWFPLRDAVRLLGQLPYRPLREPVVAHLSGDPSLGSHWRYDSPDLEAVVTAGVESR